jgi:hypothetical protein
MCGLFGVVSSSAGAPITLRDLADVVHMGVKGQRRGSDASGLLLVSVDRSIDVDKADCEFRTLERSARSRVRQAVSERRLSAVLGHSRLETHGATESWQNNQPILYGRWAVLHNGIILNHARLMQELAVGTDNAVTTDSVAIAALLEQWLDGGRGAPLDEVFSRLDGEYSIIAVSAIGDVVCHTNVGNLYSARRADGTTALASEPRQFSDSDRRIAERLDLNRSVVVREGLATSWPPAEIEVRIASQAGHTSLGSGLHLTEEKVSSSFVEDLDRVVASACERAASLRRCARCVLPATFPELRFDSAGVCSICNSFIQPTYAGVESLAAAIESASPDGRSAVVCLSGGRDSSYVLHLVAELGFTPIAYTYDWGMVTTAARENMARLCGRLGVEHVLVSPNLATNRRRIRRALTAWLKNPRVATLPILMAGDKPYFRYAAIVAHERGGLPAIMADHPMETTGFKSGLAGAKPTPSAEGGVAYRLGASSLLRMGFSYMGHAARAPGLIPAVATEGLVGFYDYYVRDHNFIRPFQYVPWIEDEIESTLRNTYGWDSGSDRSTTAWRMGDGTAPFYNLIYYIALGMTEHDALRANQVRFGLLSRSEALDRLGVDNRFKPLGLASYFATVGVDATWALGRIVQFGDITTATSAA